MFCYTVFRTRRISDPKGSFFFVPDGIICFLEESNKLIPIITYWVKTCKNSNLMGVIYLTESLTSFYYTGVIIRLWRPVGRRGYIVRPVKSRDIKS